MCTAFIHNVFYHCMNFQIKSFLQFGSTDPDKNLNLKLTKGNNSKIRVAGLWFLYTAIFVAFVKDNATMSSTEYFENHASYLAQNRRK